MQLISYLKQHKIYAFFGAGFFLLVFAIFYFDALPTFAPPVVQEPVVSSKKPLNIVRTFPEQGTYSTLNTLETFTFAFSHPIQIDTLQYNISPRVEVEVLYSPDNPNVVVFMPFTPGWKPDVNYRISLWGVTSLDGQAQMQERFEYTYLNEYPSQAEIDEWYEDGSHFTNEI